MDMINGERFGVPAVPAGIVVALEYVITDGAGDGALSIMLFG